MSSSSGLDARLAEAREQVSSSVPVLNFDDVPVFSF